MSVALTVGNLSKSFSPDLPPAVDDVSFVAAPGEIIVLLGPSGCGKTTTLRMVAGLEQPTQGLIRINDQAVYESATGALVAPQHRQIGMVFQSYAVWPHMTVFENVAYPLRRRRLTKMELRDRVTDTLKLVGLEDYAGRSVVALSGGQMQRVALARALVYQPRIVLLDEPLSNLDAKLRIRLRDDLRAIIKQLGLTALYVTHDQEEAVVIGDRIGVMRDGKLLQMSAAVDLYNNPADLFVANFTGVTNTLSGRMVNRNGVYGRVNLDGSTAHILAKVPEALRDGEAVLVGLRPENIMLSEPTAAGSAPQQFAGKIMRRRFHGGQSVYTVALLGTKLDVVELGTAPRFAPDADVLVGIPPDLCWAFPAAGLDAVAEEYV
ncbi:ABC transporter ATP-binding protein [Hyphomicrobium sp. CS1BSMeth3]|uniref:ABC transporter ATP-binding protein n=1 Tax=Hyphomicrobium sp. CS1BSMeth3 TaxID=1892844 RepID=UPI000930003A|nr:ABC transporter ATP-binding protein [Hyphomicrobium sp. CS1BSMeth3]